MIKNTPPDLLESLERAIKDIDDLQQQKSKNVLSKYPVTFSIVTVIAIAAVLHGAQNIFDSIPFFNEHPVVTLLLGMCILIATGSTYKILQNKL
ncbi:MAG TPA: hypothetical protein PJ997_01735 [Candidatus Paceibacterota bacterium]|nr:hypothetical protein [Candidatus Paceibacterota bacterium]HMP19039.1 hypothetical protein [Candidatus Paceibacterota bacterium]HMP85196.1 hypothetical protein [Candidatus Paceibacterota bacterium]